MIVIWEKFVKVRTNFRNLIEKFKSFKQNFKSFKENFYIKIKIEKLIKFKQI